MWSRGHRYKSSSVYMNNYFFVNFERIFKNFLESTIWIRFIFWMTIHLLKLMILTFIAFQNLVIKNSNTYFIWWFFKQFLQSRKLWSIYLCILGWNFINCIILILFNNVVSVYLHKLSIQVDLLVEFYTFKNYRHQCLHHSLFS